MTMISVFRIEDKFGQGMYNSRKSLSIDLAPNYKNELKRHPQISHEIREFLHYQIKKQSWLFGFPTVESARNWVYKKEWAEFLDKEGFTFCEFHIDEEHVKSDGIQLIFNHDHATIVNSKFVTDALEHYQQIEPKQESSKSVSLNLFDCESYVKSKGRSFNDICRELGTIVDYYVPPKEEFSISFKEVLKKPYYRTKERY